MFIYRAAINGASPCDLDVAPLPPLLVPPQAQPAPLQRSRKNRSKANRQRRKTGPYSFRPPAAGNGGLSLRGSPAYQMAARQFLRLVRSLRVLACYRPAPSVSVLMAVDLALARVAIMCGFCTPIQDALRVPGSFRLAVAGV